MITGLVIYYIISTGLCLFLTKKIDEEVRVNDLLICLSGGWFLWPMGLKIYLNNSDAWYNFWNRKVF